MTCPHFPVVVLLITVVVLGNSKISCGVDAEEDVETGNRTDVVTGSGSPDILTSNEVELVTQLRLLVQDVLYKDYMKTDEYLVRFLRARNYDVRRAKQMVEKTMAWRKENKMDTILLEDFGALERLYPIVIDGVDNYGRPLVFFNVGAIDPRKVALSGNTEKFLRLTDAILEYTESVVREMQVQTGHINISRGFLIADMSGYNLRQHGCIQCLQMIPHLFETLANYYPDRMYRFYGVNTPSVFLPIFELIRPFLSEHSKKVIRLFDHNADEWKKVLLSEIPADQLPKLYGGTKTGVVPTTISGLRKTNSYAKAAYGKIRFLPRFPGVLFLLISICIHKV